MTGLNYANAAPFRRASGAAPPRPPEVDILIWVATVLLSTVAALLILGLTGFLVGLVLVPILGAATPIVVILLLILLAAMMEALRRRRAGLVIAYLEQATRLNLPLPAMLRAAEHSERGQTRRALRRMRIELEAGMSVHDAVAVALPGVKPRTLGLLGSAERSGRLPFALERLSRDAATRVQGRPGGELYLRWYPATLALVTATIVTTVCLFVMPKFFEIFDDFDLPLPWQTVALARVWEVLMVPVVVIVGLATLLYVGRVLATILAPRLIPRGPVRWVQDQLAWRLPVIGGVTRWRALADACHVMADALDAGHPFDYAVTEASRSGTNAVLAERLAVWADHTRGGQPVVDGAARAKMPAMMVGLLRTAGGADVADVLRFLARYYDSRFGRASVMLNAALVPSLSLVAGAVVGSIIVALFLPLIRMIDHLSGVIWNM